MELEPEKIVAWGTIVATGATAIWAVRTYALRSLKRLVRIEKRVNLLWSFQMSRAYAEAIESGHAVPAAGKYAVKLSTELRMKLEPIALELQRMYRENPKCTQDEFHEMVEANYQQWLVDNVCIPFQVHHGACLHFAYEVAREGMGTPAVA